ncbi:hypothetical protein F2P81_004835 [Scophthalmus maximus]|uniref:Uncharacterized protein n=1 Tax=Scophthalmus maximus TaxID=52904 RepID=A0A6A4TGC7_SCOMX|nr:hypothetical protein F2P81_004835 [Scophthalmus maximus]
MQSGDAACGAVVCFDRAGNVISCDRSEPNRSGCVMRGLLQLPRFLMTGPVLINRHSHAESSRSLDVPEKSSAGQTTERQQGQCLCDGKPSAEFDRCYMAAYC